MHVLGAGVKLNIARGVGPEIAAVARVDLIGPKLNASVEVIESSTVEVHVNGEREQVTLFPSMNEYEALRQELAILGRDAIFEDVLALTQVLQGRA
jgi:hypothetical protein